MRNERNEYNNSSNNGTFCQKRAAKTTITGEAKTERTLQVQL